MRRALMALRLEVDSSIVDDIEARFNAVLVHRAASRSVSGETPRDWTDHDHVLRWLAKDDALSMRTTTLLLEVADFLGDGRISRAPATDAEIEAAVDAYGQCCIASQVHASGTAGVGRAVPRRAGD